MPYVKKFSHAKTLYQCHDLHYLRFLREYEISKDRTSLDLSHRIEKIELKVIQDSDVFLTFSQDEKDTIQKKLPGKSTEVIPLFFYERLNPPITDFSKRRGILFVGGFIHKPNVDAILWFSKEVFPEIQKVCPEIVFFVAGSHPPAEITGLKGPGIEILGYVSEEQLTALYYKVRLVVVPLRFGAGVKGKTIEAIHYSLPVVSTEIGIEGIGLNDIVNPTDDPKEFADKVSSLYKNESALINFSFNLHDYSKKNLTKTAAKAQMSKILTSLK